MASRINNVTGITLMDVLPDFQFQSSQGPKGLHDYFKGSWGILFSHPDDFTPVCTTELGEIARLENAGEFLKRNTKLLGLSCNSTESHLKWILDVEKYSNTKVNYPIIADEDRKIASQLGMLSPDHLDQIKGLPLTVRTLFILDEQVRVRLMITYPASTGRNFVEILRVLDSLQLTSQRPVATPANWQQGDKVCVIPSLSCSDAEKKFPDLETKQLPSEKNYLRFTQEY